MVLLPEHSVVVTAAGVLSVGNALTVAVTAVLVDAIQPVVLLIACA